MFSTILNWFISMMTDMLTSKYFYLFYILPSFILMRYGLNCLEPLWPQTKEDLERDEKYKAFRRQDRFKISYLVCYLMTPLLFLRWLISWGMCAFCFFSYKLINLTMGDKKILTGWQLELQFMVFKLVSFIHRIMFGCISCEETRVYVDYSEYLGKDSKVTYDNPGTIISNH